jgi:hypothetical protein
MKNMENIPLIPKIHFGEFSMINNSIIPNTIIVSSDKNALKIYKTNVRINPESDPVKTYRIGSIPK